MQSPSYTAQKPINVRPVRNKQVNTCIEVKYQKYRINALVDTGSDITIAGLDLATKYRWTMYEHPTKSVKLTNNENMLIEKCYVRDVSGWQPKYRVRNSHHTGYDLLGWTGCGSKSILYGTTVTTVSSSATEDGLAFGTKTAHTAFVECMWAKTFCFSLHSKRMWMSESCTKAYEASRSRYW